MIAHSVSVMVIQAGGARLVMGEEPERAEESLRSVERAGREALAEMRRLLGVLGEGDPRALAPQPGLGDIEPLLAHARSAGISADLHVDGEPAPVSPALDLCAYRIVQEALTNAIKHAAPARAVGQCALAGRARSSSRSPTTVAGPARSTAPVAGTGSPGMRERVALHGGSVEAGAAPGRWVHRSCSLAAGSGGAVLSDVRDRSRGVDRRVVDAILAVAAIVAIELTCWLSPGISDSDRVVTAVAAVLFAAPIAVRRVWPAVALVFSLAVVTVSTPFGGQLLSNDNAVRDSRRCVLSYSAGAWLDTRRSVVALDPRAGAALGMGAAAGPDGSTTGLGQTAWRSSTSRCCSSRPGWSAASSAGTARGPARFDELAAQAAAEQDAHDAAAIADERARIGCELQDIIAHSVSAMVIQAGSARLLLRSDPDRARDSILNVEQTGREALSDLRRLLGMLRKDDDPRALSPQPGLDQLPALIDSLRRAGLACERRTRRRSDRPDPRNRPRRLPGDRGGAARGRRPARRPRPRHGPLRAARPRARDPRRRRDPRPRQRPSRRSRNGSRSTTASCAREPRDEGFVAARAPTARRGGPGMTISVLIADDQALVRAGFRMILETDPEIRVVAEAGDGAQAVDAGADPARRRADGHPDAGHGRARGDAAAPRRAKRPRGC